MLAPNPTMMPPLQQPQYHDVTIVRKKKRTKCCIEAVPPEEFGISRHARSIRDAGYCFHEVMRRQEELLNEGYKESQIKGLPTYSSNLNTEQLSRDTVDESMMAGGDGGLNDANRLIKITEHYIRMDYEKNGKAKLYRVVTGGEGEVLTRDGELQVIEEDMIPFAAMTPVPVTHRFWGRSVADLVMDIQKIKTALLRGILDNAYMVTNPRVEVAEQHASDNTLDDLLVARPGGIVRTKLPGGLNWQEIPAIAPAVFPVIEYMDATREWRTGVSRAGQGLDPNTLQNQSATAANQLFTASQARMKLIARIFAETGIRDLFQLVHATIRKNGGSRQTVRLRNDWVQIDPREWQERNDMTVNVGLGTGSKGEQMFHLDGIIAAQIQGVQAGLVSRQNLFNSAKQKTRLAGFKNVEEFFVDPGKPPDQNNPNAQPLPPPADPKQAEIAAKAQAEQGKIAADAAHQKFKTEADMAFQLHKSELDQQKETMKFNLDKDLAIIKAQLEERVAMHKMQMDERKLELDTAAATHKANLEVQTTEHSAAMKEKETEAKTKQQTSKQPKASIVVKHEADQLTGPLADVIDKFGKQLAAHHEKMSKVPENKGMRIVRDPKTGRVSHTEPIH